MPLWPVRGYNSLTKPREIAEPISNDGRPSAAYQRRVESTTRNGRRGSRHQRESRRGLPGDNARLPFSRSVMVSRPTTALRASVA